MIILQEKREDNLSEYKRADVEKCFVKSAVTEVNGEKIGLIGASPIDMFSRVTSAASHTDCYIDDLEKTINEIQIEADKLKGAWLREWGFSENTPISVQCEDGRLVITPRPLDDEEQRVTMVAEAEGGYEKPERKHYVRCK